GGGGVGERRAGGTGAGAVGAGGRRLGKTGSRVEVVTRGGRLRVEWDGRGPARLIGPARVVYRGELWPEV
ncbi:MAG TPA: hypothetical protein P5137_09455, partial [Candidatus Brocadiia bacterium]|nr:hypothetical protein [Candidatus Brocadiia bacterium]